jgi:hypothetical protein
VTVVTSGKDHISVCAEIECILNLRDPTETVEPPQISPAHSGTGEPQ